MIASFNATAIKPELLALMNVTDFNTPVTDIDIRKNKTDIPQLI